MRLPVPARLDGGLITDMTLKEPTAGDIANAKREADRGDPYSAMVEWCTGCVEAASGDSEVSTRQDVKRAVRALPFVSAMQLMVTSKVEMEGDDGASSVETCPYCGKMERLAAQGEGEDRVDLRDHVLSLPVRVIEDGMPLSVTYDLSSPVEISRKDNNEPVIVASQVTVRYPTLGDCSRASRAEESKAQLAILAEALEKVNGEEMSPAWKSTFGRMIFERMKAKDVNALSARLREWGIDPRVTRTCRNCGMEWKSEVNVMGFFASALGTR